MIDFDEYDKMYVDGFFCRSDLGNLVERLRQAEKDAARYRWLRDNSTAGQSFGGFMIDVDCDGKPSNPFSGVDALIDEAMQCSGDDK